MRIVAISREEIREALKRGGVDEVYTAKNGLEALNILKRIHGEDLADIILVEKSLADMIGEDEIKELKLRKPLPLIVVMKTDTRNIVGL